MSITKSYNKQTDTYYAYETTYEWSDEKQKKIQRKKCIGQFDPGTGRIIPNGKVGRPSLSNCSETPAKSGISNKKNHGIPSGNVEKLADRLEQIEKSLQILSEEIHGLHAEIRSLSAQKS